MFEDNVRGAIGFKIPANHLVCNISDRLMGHPGGVMN